MAEGANANPGWSSYLFVGRELTFGTYNTCSSSLLFTKSAIKTVKESKILEEISTQRTFLNRVALSRKVEGAVEFSMAAENDACQYILQNAFGGGAVTSATASGDTVGAGAFEHTYSVGGFNVTYSSLCLNERKGDATNGKVFEYSGGRVNKLSLKAGVDEVLMCSADIIMQDCTQTGTDLSSTATAGQIPLSFVNMRFSVENSFASLTAASFWHVQSVDWSINNNIKSDAASRRIGSDVVDVLMPGAAVIEIKASMRWDTLTAYNAMLNSTELACQLVFQGATISGSKLPYAIQLDHPSVYIKDAGDPEIGGPDDILKSDVVFQIIRDSASGYACQATVRNTTASYA